MSSFINNIINRHLAQTPSVQPRLRGRFEGLKPSAIKMAGVDLLHSTDGQEENPATGVKGDANEMIPGRDVANHSPIDQTKPYSEGPPGPDYGEKDRFLYHGTIEKVVVRGSDYLEGPFNENSITDQTIFRADQVSLDNSGPAGPIDSSTEIKNTASEVTSKESHLNDIKHEQHHSGRLDLSIKRFSDKSDFDRGEETENLGSPFSGTVHQTSLEEKFNNDRNNSVPGAIQNGYGTEVQQPFGTVLRVPEQPVIKVSIGRINIRAEVQKVAPVMMRKQVTSQPRMSLEDYLKKQNNPAK